MSSRFNTDARVSEPTVGGAVETSAVRIWQRTLIIISVACLMVLSCFWDGVVAAVWVWRNSETFSHGFLVAPIVVYIIWGLRRQITELVPSPNYWGFSLLAIVGIGWLLGHVASVMVVQQLALVAMFQLLVFTIAGWPVTHALLFPLGFLFFAVPFGEDLVRPLQDYTALFTVKALQLTGIPVYRDGWVIVIPSGVWEVAEACAGVRYVIPSVMLGCLFSFFVYQSWRRRVVFILACFFGAIAANGVRAYGIVMLAHLTDNRLAVGVDHLIAGWIFFSVVMFALFCMGLYWKEPASTVARDAGAMAQDEKPAPHAGSQKAMILTAFVAVALLSVIRVTAGQLLSDDRARADEPTISSPVVAPPWQALKADVSGWKPQFHGADKVVLQSYSAGNRKVSLFVAYYRPYQRQGAELIGGGNVLFDTKEWTPVSAGSVQTVVDGERVTMKRMVVRSNNRTRLVWSVYCAGGQFTSNPYIAKLLEIKSIVLRERKGSALISITVDIESGAMSEAADTLRNFITHLRLTETLIPAKLSEVK